MNAQLLWALAEAMVHPYRPAAAAQQQVCGTLCQLLWALAEAMVHPYRRLPSSRSVVHCASVWRKLQRNAPGYCKGSLLVLINICRHDEVL